MGEHKLKEDGNGDEPKALSSHIVEAVNMPIWGEKGRDELSQKVEAAYTRLSERAARENSLILGVVQAVSAYSLLEEQAYVLVMLTAQRISREDFERQQRAAQIAQGGPRR